jgi:Tol biopolymer transport system component
LIPAIGGVERKITEISGGGRPTWSPDGNWLAISDTDSGPDRFALYLISVDSGERRRLTSPPKQFFGDSDPAFSADGRSLAFRRSTDAHSPELNDLYVLAFSDGSKPAGEPAQVTFGNKGVQYPAWTADGREIVFASGSIVSKGLWRVSNFAHAAARAEPQRLPSVGDDASEPAISGSKHRLVYVNRFSHNSLWRVATPGLEGKRQRPPNQPTLLISSTRDDNSAQISPDGKKIAFQSTRSGNTEVWVCDADGSNAVQLTSFGGPEVTTARWSPDSKRIAFDANAAGEYDVYVVDADGGKPKRMTTNPANDGNPSWSPDGEWIYFDSARTGGQQVWKMPANGGEAIQVTKDGAYAPRVSPDGKFLYYTKALNSTSLWKVSLEGGEPSKVLDNLSNYENVAIVKSGVYFTPSDDAIGNSSSIQFLRFGTNTISEVTSFEKSFVYGVSVSPDGAWMLYSPELQFRSELMLVENFR